MILNFLKALIIGATMLVPGVSGGSMAMILGVYHQLISSISQLRGDIRKNALFLTLFIAGGLLGILLFAKPMVLLIERYEHLTLYFFIGAVLGGIPLIIKESGIKQFSIRIAFCVLGGLLLVYGVTNFSVGNIEFDTTINVGKVLYLVIAGLIAAVALVLPGISVSYLLLVMGLYDPIMVAISEFNVGFLAPLAIGLILGVLLTTKLLEYIMTYFPSITYMVILGFVLGSLIELFPGLPSGIEWLGCTMTLAAGFITILFLSSLKKD